MKEIEITMLLDRVKELKAMFVIGNRIVPYLEEILLVLKDAAPLVNEITASIDENIHNMSKALTDLNTVSESTETAIGEVMETVDGILYKAGLVSSNLQLIREVGEHSNIADNADFQWAMTNSDDVLKGVQQDAQNIITSLQIRDVTSRKLAAVNDFLENLQVKLGAISQRFEDVKFSDLTTDEKFISNDNSVGGTSARGQEISYNRHVVEMIGDPAQYQEKIDDIVREVQEEHRMDGNADSNTVEKSIANESIPIDMLVNLVEQSDNIEVPISGLDSALLSDNDI